ncbi:uncharacterized protein BP01DRAFT_406241 [Aspergillus saccharolyticus JOP 1030-1]|uniref:Protein kinase domain-containing protein n=1 Tax=Aspergillus saccharolyticus JOP 1030-1 TaxID=1450539 RepID=A0A318ZNX5_9EURO|nr:hypothetical protein BP01DRAFT_406241 [Aspergillus saccharolyticus JOP 1030-1]PYH48677.1 hypothetical protein BP01DRAFT_406241 [Aspergillus saccharolyticus JOP 1030-1]
MIRFLGVVHTDLAPTNILWNPELDRVLIIDLHLCVLELNKMKKTPKRLTSSNLLVQLTGNEKQRQHCSNHWVCLQPLTENCPNDKYDLD